MYDITIEMKGKADEQAYLLPENIRLETETVDEDTLKIYLPKLEIFRILRLE